MSRKHSLDRFAVFAMVLLTASWGFQQVAIKWAIPEIPPVWQSGLRSLAATVLVGFWMLWTRQPWKGGLMLPGLVAGLLFGLEFGLLFFALLHTDAARAVLLLYTAPFVVALAAHFLITGERLAVWGWFGVLLAFAGTAIVLRASFDLDGDRALGDLCAVGAGIAWGLTTIVIRKTGLAEAAPSQTLFYQLVVSGILLCAVGALFEGPLAMPESAVTVASLIYQIVVVATVSLLAWFALVARYSVTKLSVFTFMTPLFGALAGIVFLDEQVGPHHLIALFCIMAGIVIVNLFGTRKAGGAIAYNLGNRV
ncbi:MAG: DMT family transporter [Pseudomonadota bacterium]